MKSTDKILKEYVPQTGRGFSDGSEFIGKNTKGPYERSAEDDPWYKKVYKKDTKNIKILIGSGSKKFKSGAPYIKNPPKRRSVEKISAPVLEEGNLPQEFAQAFMSLQNAEINFITKKPIEFAFKEIILPGKKYKAFIKGDKITSQIENFPGLGTEATIKKQTFLNQLEKRGELCEILECDSSTIQVFGQPVKTFFSFIQEIKIDANVPNVATEPIKQEKKVSEEEKRKMAQNTRLSSVGNIVNNFMEGSDVRESIKQEFGLHPSTQAFANGFYEVMQTALGDITNEDKRKAAALLTVLLAEIMFIPLDVTSRIAGEIPDEFINGAKTLFSNIYGPIAEKIEQLKTVYQKKIEPATDTVKTIVKDVEKKAEKAKKQLLMATIPEEYHNPPILTMQEIKDQYGIDPIVDTELDSSGLKSKYGGFRNYIKLIWQIYQANKEDLKKWTAQDTINYAEVISRKHNVKKYLILGILRGECGFLPTGTWGQSLSRKGSPAGAIAENSTAFGMGGVLVGTHDSIKNKMNIPHYMLWKPEYGIESAALVIKVLLNLNNQDLEKAIRTYAGRDDTAAAKMKDIQWAKNKYGDE